MHAITAVAGLALLAVGLGIMPAHPWTGAWAVAAGSITIIAAAWLDRDDLS